MMIFKIRVQMIVQSRVLYKHFILDNVVLGHTLVCSFPAYLSSSRAAPFFILDNVVLGHTLVCSFPAYLSSSRAAPFLLSTSLSVRPRMMLTERGEVSFSAMIGL